MAEPRIGEAKHLIDRDKILVIDDQIGQVGSPEHESFLRAVGYYCETGDARPTNNYPYEFEFHTGEGGVDAVKQAVRQCWPDHKGRRWALVLLDVSFGDDQEFGFSLLRALRCDAALEHLPIVMLTSEDLGKNEKANRGFADGFFPKASHDFKPLLSREKFDEVVLKCGLVPDTRNEKQLAATGTKRLLGRSLPMLLVLRDARAYALYLKGDRILLGQSGTGKTQLAGYMHCFTGRNGRYTHWSASPGNPSLEETALWGEWEGAHSKADEPEPGLIEQAHGGTFFLDEVALLHSDNQARFLQFREKDHDGSRTLSRIGKFPQAPAKVTRAKNSVQGAKLLPDHRIQVDVLLFTGTNEDVESDECRRKLGFRDDLYFALGSALRCPGLNDRREDISELFTAFVRRAAPTDNVSIDREVIELLHDADWSQGNIRLLERVAQHSAQKLSMGFTTIAVNNLPSEIRTSGTRNSIKTDEVIECVETPIPAVSSSGSLARAELEHLKSRLQLLEQAAEETRGINRATGVKDGAYSPALAIQRLMGREKINTTDAKRVINDILSSVLDPPDYLRKAYGEYEVNQLQVWVRSRPVLMALYSYAMGEIDAQEIHQRAVHRGSS